MVTILKQLELLVLWVFFGHDLEEGQVFLQELAQLEGVKASILSAHDARVDLHGHVVFHVQNPHSEVASLWHLKMSA